MLATYIALLRGINVGGKNKLPMAGLAALFAETFRTNHFLAEGLPTETLHVLFLADTPTAEQVAMLDPDRSAPDTFLIQGRDISLHLPNGVADTRLTNAYFDAKLATVSTSRNWKTVTKMLELSGSLLRSAPARR